MTNKNKLLLGDDMPKANPWRDDLLGFAPFAKRVADILIQMHAPNGYVIGLHGKWGSGKSTAINFVLEYLRKHNVEATNDTDLITHLDFRPWIVSGHQDLITAYFKLLSESLGPTDTRFARSAKRAAGLIASTSDNLVEAAATVAITVDPSGGVASGLAGQLAKQSVSGVLGRYLKTPSLQKAYEDLRSQLERSKRRFLVTIDDLDRLEDHEIKSIMQLVKTVGRLPNIVYLLAYDREIVWNAVETYGERIGPRFAEKIVQQELELPQASRQSLLRILDEEVGFLTKFTPESTRWHYIVRDGVQRWIGSPRDVLRLSNAVKFAWPALEGEFDPQDLLAIEGLRLFDNVAFDWIRANRDFLFSEGRYLMGADEERRANVASLRSRLTGDAQGPVLELLAVLFPNHGKWFEGDRYIVSERHVETHNRRGIASEAGYDSYFSLYPSSDAIPKVVVDDVIAHFSNSDYVSKIIRSYTGKKNSRGRQLISVFIEDLRFRLAGGDAPEPTEQLLRALLVTGEDILAIPAEDGLFVIQPRSGLRSLIRDILERWGTTAAGERLIRAFEGITSPVLMADIYVDRGRELGVIPDDVGGHTAVIGNKAFEELGLELLPRIVAAAEDGTLAKAPYFWNVARAWQYLDKSPAGRAWLNSGITDSGGFAAKVAEGILARSTSSQGSFYQYREDSSEDIYDIQHIYEQSRKHLANSDLTDKERKLLHAIVAGVETRRSGGSSEDEEESLTSDGHGGPT